MPKMLPAAKRQRSMLGASPIEPRAESDDIDVLRFRHTSQRAKRRPIVVLLRALELSATCHLADDTHAVESSRKDPGRQGRVVQDYQEVQWFCVAASA